MGGNRFLNGVQQSGWQVPIDCSSGKKPDFIPIEATSAGLDKASTEIVSVDAAQTKIRLL